MSTYYEILGVPQNADEAAIRKAYLRASLRCHPDKNPGREEEAKVSTCCFYNMYICSHCCSVFKFPLSNKMIDINFVSFRQSLYKLVQHIVY